jgi:hypothetical protein
MEEYAEIQLNFRQTVNPGQGVRLTQSYLLAGTVTQVIFSFPPGCAGLLDMALTKDERPFYPLQGYLTLDSVSPVFSPNISYYANEPLKLEIRNRDAVNPHTPTCAVTIRFKKPSWW